MRILINDFGGYPFPVELSRCLSKMDHVITHCYISNINTPHGNMSKNSSDGDTLEIKPIVLDFEFKKYSFTGRLKGEYEFANKVAELIDSFQPDIFLSANTPLLAQAKLQRKCRNANVKFIYWCQDIHSIALKGFLRKKIPLLGNLLFKYFEHIEINLLKKSDYIITISEDFNYIFKEWGVSTPISTIHNWAPLNEIKPLLKKNEWSLANNIDSKFIILYSGTLGVKHNPSLIANAAMALKNEKLFSFFVVSEGLGADYLKQQKLEHDIDNLVILPFQEYGKLPQILASADVLLSILENDAAQYSVPSKVLTYLCTNRPIILSVPKDNLAAKIVESNQAGFCIDIGNTEQLVEKIKLLANNPDLRNKLGANGRKYAEENFDMKVIAKKFLDIFSKLSN